MYNIYLKKSQLLKNILVCRFVFSPPPLPPLLSFIFHHTLALLFIHTHFIIRLFHYLSIYLHLSIDRSLLFIFLPRKYFLNFRQQTRQIISRANFHVNFYSRTYSKILFFFFFFYRFSTMDKSHSPCKLTLFCIMISRLIMLYKSFYIYMDIYHSRTSITQISKDNNQIFKMYKFLLRFLLIKDNLYNFCVITQRLIFFQL